MKTRLRMMMNVLFIYIVKIYECKHSLCNKTFLDKNSFKKHLITHNEKQYICTYPECGKKFLDNSKLRRHSLVHTVSSYNIGRKTI